MAALAHAVRPRDATDCGSTGVTHCRGCRVFSRRFPLGSRPPRTTIRAEAQRRDGELEEWDAILERAKTVPWSAERRGASIFRLRQPPFGSRTEETRQVLGRGEATTAKDARPRPG
jgi:hypothetical protein